MVPRVKICGVRTPEIMTATIAAGADDVGLVFFARSPRHLDLEAATRLASIARGRCRIVALTVDADDATLAAIVEQVRPDVLQLHGAETPARCRAIVARWQVAVLKAIGIAASDDLAHAATYRDTAAILLDAKPAADAVLPGGNGAAFDWSLLAGFHDRMPFMLSGGLTPANVAEAIRITGARAVDVSSGVETAPGVKDAGLIRRFIGAAKG